MYQNSETQSIHGDHSNVVCIVPWKAGVESGGLDIDSRRYEAPKYQTIRYNKIDDSRVERDRIERFKVIEAHYHESKDDKEKRLTLIYQGLGSFTYQFKKSSTGSRALKKTDTIREEAKLPEVSLLFHIPSESV